MDSAFTMSDRIHDCIAKHSADYWLLIGTNPCLCILINSVMRKQGRTYKLGCRRLCISPSVYDILSLDVLKDCLFSRPYMQKHMLHYENKHCLHWFSWGITTRLKVWLSLPLPPAGCLCPCLCCCVCPALPALPAQDRFQHGFLCPGLEQWKSIMDEYLNFSSTLSRNVVTYCSMAFLNLTPGPI